MSIRRLMPIGYALLVLRGAIANYKESMYSKVGVLKRRKELTSAYWNWCISAKFSRLKHKLSIEEITSSQLRLCGEIEKHRALHLLHNQRG